VSRTQIFVWCVVLIVLEIFHLKWIWWTYWDCKKGQRKHKDCGSSSKWIMLL
jgi:cbb3-type cytochrome oxidase subunit 3